MSQNRFAKENKGMTILTRIISGIALAYILVMIVMMVYLAVTGAPDNMLIAVIIGLFVGSTIIYAILMFFHEKKIAEQKKLKKKGKKVESTTKK